MSVRIFRKTDRIKVKIDSIIVEIAPLTRFQKEIIQQAGIVNKKSAIDESNVNLQKMMHETLKYSIKSVSGIQDIDGNDYQVEFEDDTKQALTDDCIDELNSIECYGKLMIALSGLLNGIPSGNKIYNPANPNEVIEGVEIIIPKKKAVKKNKK